VLEKACRTHPICFRQLFATIQAGCAVRLGVRNARAEVGPRCRRFCQTIAAGCRKKHDGIGTIIWLRRSCAAVLSDFALLRTARVSCIRSNLCCSSSSRLRADFSGENCVLLPSKREHLGYMAPACRDARRFLCEIFQDAQPLYIVAKTWGLVSLEMVGASLGSEI
jgi:hypothetical protein